MRLQTLQPRADAAVLDSHAGIDTGVLDDGEEPGNQRPVVEDVEVALHVGDRTGAAALGTLRRCGPCRLTRLRRGRDVLAVDVERVLKRAELHAPGLVRGEDLEHLEVGILVFERFDEGWQVDRRALGRGAALRDPADVAIDELLRGLDRDLLAR